MYVQVPAKCTEMLPVHLRNPDTREQANDATRETQTFFAKPTCGLCQEKNGRSREKGSVCGCLHSQSQDTTAPSEKPSGKRVRIRSKISIFSHFWTRDGVFKSCKDGEAAWKRAVVRGFKHSSFWHLKTAPVPIVFCTETERSGLGVGCRGFL